MSVTAGGTVTADAPDGTISAGFTTSTDKTFTSSPVVSGGPSAHGRLHVHPATDGSPLLVPRLSEHVYVEVNEPLISNGQPYNPRFRATGTVALPTATLGTGHIRALDDPDPVWNGASYDVAPPDTPANSALVRWSVNTLPDPASYGGAYYLGTRDTFDNTSGLPSAADQWDSAPGSDVAMPWTSTYPFKPVVSDHLHWGDNGASYTAPKALLFSAQRVQSMFCDTGTLLQPPFTILLVAAVLAFPQRNYRHWLLDAGADPGSAVSTAVRQRWFTRGVQGTTRLSEQYGYRNALTVLHDEAAMFTDATPVARVGRVPFHHNRKPKVFGICVNGDSSWISVFTANGRHKRPVHLSANGAQRFLMLGRRNGIIDRDYASHMAVFEVRLVTAALTDDQLDAHGAQLASTWKLSEYP